MIVYNYLVIKNKKTGRLSINSRLQREELLDRLRNKKEVVDSLVLKGFLLKREAQEFIDRVKEGDEILKKFL